MDGGVVIKSKETFSMGHPHIYFYQLVHVPYGRRLTHGSVCTLVYHI